MGALGVIARRIHRDRVHRAPSCTLFSEARSAPGGLSGSSRRHRCGLVLSGATGVRRLLGAAPRGLGQPHPACRRRGVPEDFPLITRHRRAASRGMSSEARVDVPVPLHGVRRRRGRSLRCAGGPSRTCSASSSPDLEFPRHHHHHHVVGVPRLKYLPPSASVIDTRLRLSS